MPIRHLKKAIGALVVYDIADEKSFENLSWHIENLKQHAEPEIVITILGNKTDLLENNSIRVDKDKAIAFAKERQCFYEETSALTNQNVNESFEKLVARINDLFYIFVS